MQYLLYYYDICSVISDFQIENDLSDAEVCACLYDYSTLLQEEVKHKSDLPSATNIWLTGASGKRDFDILDRLGDEDDENIWACNERTKRGVLRYVVYCRAAQCLLPGVILC